MYCKNIHNIILIISVSKLVSILLYFTELISIFL